MTATILFSALAALTVYMAGRRDVARDPRLTSLVLALLAVFPVVVWMMPKIAVLPMDAGTVTESGFPWMGLVKWIWLAGFVVALLRLAMAARVLHRWRTGSTLIQQLERIEIRLLPEIKGPVAAGVFRPVVFVPDAWNGWSDRIRQIVLDHETTHHRRHDPLWRWVGGIACAVNWFNPLVAWMFRRLTLQCEFVCDASVLSHGVPSRDYANLLCDLADDTVSRGPALAMAERTSLEERVRRLMGPCQPQGVVGVSLLVTMTLVAAVVFAAIGSKSVVISPDEVSTRWAADPFPGEAGR